MPLSADALDVLRQAQAQARGALVFEGASSGRPVALVTLNKILRAATSSDVVVHGLRSSFRDWASERTNFANEVCEMALAHTIKSKVEAAYRRGDLFEKRRQLMASWADFAAGASANVIPLRA